MSGCSKQQTMLPHLLYVRTNFPGGEIGRLWPEGSTYNCMDDLNTHTYIFVTLNHTHAQWGERSATCPGYEVTPTHHDTGRLSLVICPPYALNGAAVVCGV